MSPLEQEIKDEDIKVFLEAIKARSNYDFTNYSLKSLKRRIAKILTESKFTISQLEEEILQNSLFMEKVVKSITVNTTELFRDPPIWINIKEEILPKFANLESINIWHAGCSTGEEVYSMAILLHEANLLRKSLIYATDINPEVLMKAKSGIFPLSYLRQYSENYILSGGRQDFSSYYSANYGSAKFNELLSERMIYSTHNLVSDGSFNEFHLIMCRNVFIYFDKNLQQRVFQLFDSSLETLGYLALGSKETLKFSSISPKYKQIDKEKLWRKIV